MGLFTTYMVAFTFDDLFTGKLAVSYMKSFSHFSSRESKEKWVASNWRGPELHVALCSEAATRSALWKKVFLEISQNSEEKTRARVYFLIKLQASNLYSRENEFSSPFSNSKILDFCKYYVTNSSVSQSNRFISE